MMVSATGLTLTVYAQGKGAQTAKTASKGKTLVLETSKIEGKLKRPQAALLAIEKRPVFKPIALSTNTFQKDILKSIDTSVFEYRVYTDVFTVTTK
jgi:hypothetical protein